MRRSHLFVLVVAVVFALLVPPIRSTAAQQATPQASPAPRFTNTVTVDGRRLGLTCAGSGSPTVVLVGGGRFPAEEIWSATVDAIGPVTRVCVFVRAGLGPSDPPPHSPQTAADVVADLHATLAAAGEAGPYVPVGLSLGGLFVRLYASTYPDEVAGLVLVEATPPGIYGPFAVPDPGTVAPIDFFVSESQVVVAPPPPPMPTIVIVAGTFEPAYTPGTGVTWFALQARQAKDLGARTVTAEESGHLVPIDQPEVVVTAIEDVVAAVRDPSHWAMLAIRPAGGWSLLLDTEALGVSPPELSRRLVARKVAATPMTAWGEQVAPRYIRFVYATEPVARLLLLGERLRAALARPC